MILKTLIVTVILVAIVMLALGIKMLFDKNAKFEVHSCSFDNDNAEGTCYKCQVIDPAECQEKS
jgi:hypothetical protein